MVKVLCGSAVGELHVDKLLCSKGPSKWGSSKSIIYNSLWFTPIEFEATGGEPKSRHWRKTILASDTNTPLGTHLQSIGVSSRSGSPVPSSPSMSGSPRLVGVSATSLLVDPVLALVKAYRLRGDIEGLKQAVCSSFDDIYFFKLCL